MLKLTTRASLEATNDLVSAAQEACEAYQAVLEAGADCAEMSQIIDNIAFARDTIAAHGAKWYIDNCDPENAFGAALGLTEKSLTVKAATEGLGEWLKTAWEKIKAFFKKIADWCKSLFNSNDTKANETELATAEATATEGKKSGTANVDASVTPTTIKNPEEIIKKFEEINGGESGLEGLNTKVESNINCTRHLVEFESKNFPKMLEFVDKMYSGLGALAASVCSAKSNDYHEKISKAYATFVRTHLLNAKPFAEEIAKKEDSMRLREGGSTTPKELGYRSWDDVVIATKQCRALNQYANSKIYPLFGKLTKFSEEIQRMIQSKEVPVGDDDAAKCEKLRIKALMRIAQFAQGASWAADTCKFELRALCKSVGRVSAAMKKAA